MQSPIYRLPKKLLIELDNQIDDIGVPEMLDWFPYVWFLFKALPIYSVSHLTSYSAAINDFLYYKE